MGKVVNLKYVQRSLDAKEMSHTHTQTSVCVGMCVNCMMMQACIDACSPILYMSVCCKCVFVGLCVFVRGIYSVPQQMTHT